jgi:imidazolonepropionase
MVNESIAIENARIVSCVPPAGGGALRGGAMGALRVIERGHVIVENGHIAAVGAGPAVTRAVSARIDARGRVLMPAAVDCHTHACWAGERWGEWEQKRAGASYLEILKAGGGILSTVKAVRAAPQDALASQLAERLAEMRELGTGAVEVKTGYGLDTATELKMFEAIRQVAKVLPMMVVPTLLLGHAVDADNPRQLDDMCALLETLADRQHAGSVAVDAYCEEGAWSVEMCRTLLEKAKRLGFAVRIHADQFHALGGLEMALALGARSVDHLEASTPAGIAALAASRAIGVVLPACGFALDGRFANGRALIDQGGALAVASNWNPGSAPSPSVRFAAALASRHMRLTAHEAIAAVTWNAACVLGIEHQAGAIRPGMRALLQLLPHRDERAYVHEVAGAGPDVTIMGEDVSVRVA